MMARREGPPWRLCRLTCAVLLFVLYFVPGLCNFRFLVVPNKFYLLGFGSNFVFNCTTNDPNVTTRLFRRLHPQPDFKWNELQLKPRKLIKAGDVYTVLDLSISDAGQYQCRATNASGTTIMWDDTKCVVFPIRFQAPPVYVKPKYAVVLTKGESFNFTCESVSQSTLKWFKISSSSEQAIPPSQTAQSTDVDGNKLTLVLMIKHARLSDSSVYKCMMSYHGKTGNDLARLTVHEKKKPVIISHSSTAGPVDVLEPADQEIFCIAAGYPIPLIQWSRNGKEISVAACQVSSHNRLCENSKYKLQIEKLTTNTTKAMVMIKKMTYPEDHGKYTCKAGNSVGKASSIIFINIKVKPFIFQRKDSFLALKGKPHEVRCKTVRSNPGANFTWEYQDFCRGCFPEKDLWSPLTSMTISPASSVMTNISTVSVPMKQGPTFFRCTATNAIGSSNLIVKFQRLDNPDKDFAKITLHDITINENQHIKITCATVSQLVAFNGIRWLKDNKVISPNTDARVSIVNKILNDTILTKVLFTLINTTANDSGLYTCDAFGLPQHLIVNDSVKITVRALTPPKISGLENKDVKKEDVNNGVKMVCNVSGNPKPDITWFKKKSGKWSKITSIPTLSSSNKCPSTLSGMCYFYLQPYSPLVICNPNHESHSGSFKCVARNRIGVDHAIAYLNVQEGARITTPLGRKVSVVIGDTLNETCRAKGNPTPEVQWMNAKGQQLHSGKGSAILLVERVKAKDLGNYTCTASNYMSSSVVLTVEEMKESDPSAIGAPLTSGVIAGIISGCVVFILVILIICFVIYWRQKKQMEEYREFYFLRTGQSDYKIDPDRSLLEQCNNLPYDLDWEFPEERLILGKVLGQGAFGQVLRAEAIGMAAFKPRDKGADALKQRSKLRRSMRESKKRNEYSSMRITKTTVAVKTLKEGASESDYKDLASELKILIHLGEHKNIMNILGACTRGRRVMVIIEFAPYGNLLNFLRSKREVYEPKWTKTTNNPEQEYTLVDLAMASYQVSRGMEFLASRKCVHRDLAARNILVGQDYVMKISDFGLARDIYQDDLYVKTTSGLLPVKWMALESLFDRVYTEKSDVWSFGILLWESFTLGGTPYPGLPTEQLLDYLSEGQRMQQPQNCPLEIYTIMRDCWMQHPEQRPSFVVLADRLGKVLERNIAKDNPYIQLKIDETSGTSDYYLSPCDARVQERDRLLDGYEEALPTPRTNSSLRYDSPLPSLPPDMPEIPDEDIINSPLPGIPPSYEEATKANATKNDSESSNESGIGLDGNKLQQEQKPLIVDLGDEPDFAPGNSKKKAESTV